jgi:glycosyl transferase family 1
MILILYSKCYHYVPSIHPILFNRLKELSSDFFRVVDVTHLPLEAVKKNVEQAELIVFDHSIVEAYKILHDEKRPNYIFYNRLREAIFYQEIISSVFDSTKKVIYWASMADLHGILTIEFSKLNNIGIHYQDILQRIDGIIWYYNKNNIIDLKNIPESYYEESFSRLENPIESYREVVSRVKYEVELPHCIGKNEFTEKQKKWDFYVPGIKYKTREMVETAVKNMGLKTPNSERSFYWNGKINGAVMRSNFIPTTLIFKKNYRLMKYFISRSKFSFACGSGLRYFVRKFLEIPSFGSAMVAYPPLNMDDYGFVDYESYIKVEPESVEQRVKEFIEDNELQRYLVANAKSLVLRLHTDEVRARQLRDTLCLIHSGEIASAKFEKGQYIYR